MAETLVLDANYILDVVGGPARGGSAADVQQGIRAIQWSTPNLESIQ